MSKRLILSILILLSFFTLLFSQQEELKFDLITTSDGLPGNNIVTIFQDSFGFIWISTRSGLVRYDGYNFKSISSGDSIEFTGDKLAATLAEDTENNIWIGTRRKGLIKYTRKSETLTSFPMETDSTSLLYNNIIGSILIDKDILWIGTASGLNKWDLKSNERKIFQYDSLDTSTISSNTINDIVKDSTGNLWLGTYYGLNKFTLKTEKFTRYISEKKQNDYSGNFISDLVYGQEGNIWIGSFKYGLRKFNPVTEKFTNYRKVPGNSDSLNLNQVVYVLQSVDSNIWLGTPGDGLIKFIIKENRFVNFTNDSDNPYSVVSDFIFPFLEDNTGIIWLGTAMSGICKLDKYNHKFNHIVKKPNIKNSLSSNRILSIQEDSYGKIWVGTDGRGLDSYDKKTGKWKNFNPDPNKGINLKYVVTIYEDKQKNLWCGTDGSGLYKFNRKRNDFTKFSFGSYTYQNRIDFIFEDSKNNFWLGSSRDGLKKFDRKTGEYISFNHNTEDSLSISTNYIFDIIEDKSGYLWIGTSHGLNRFDPEKKKFKTFVIDSKKPSIITNLFIDSQNRIWVSSVRDGLYLFKQKTGKFISYRNQDTPQLNKIKGIIEDHEGNLWMGNDIGIAKFNTTIKTFHNYSEKDGLLKGLINHSAFCKDSQGYMYFGGNNGVSWFNPQKIIENSVPPPLSITSINVRELHNFPSIKENVILLDTLELDYWQNDINIEFSALQFSRPYKNQYAYILESPDEEWWFERAGNEWRNLGYNNDIEFTNLPPGDYKLKIKAANSDGYWNEKGKELTIIIHPPFWETWIFRIFIIFLIIAAIYLWHKRRIEKIEARKIELEERVEERTKAAEALNSALNEVKKLKNRLLAENSYLKDEINLDHNFSELITRSKKIKKILNQVEQVSSTDSTVLILGESGTGKELIARAVHNLSLRRERPLVKVNCASLPTNLIESELFGHEKGAFTGALNQKIGRFELADGGTIFLDEIGELPLELQSKLLRVLQEKEFEKLGSHKTQKVDVRIIAATNRDLNLEIRGGKFREDLFFRLNVFPIIIPPLKERKEDIEPLVNHFVKKYSTKIGKNIDKIPQAIIDDFMNYHWPGNVRELENVIERAVVISPHNKLILDEHSISYFKDNNEDDEIFTLQENEKNLILKALKQTNGRVSGDKGAAKILGINSQTLVSRMKKLGIETATRKN